jgi:hypothetical protein
MWLQQTLNPNLPANAVIILGNASYQNVQINKSPTINIRKDNMKEWLHSHGTHYTKDATKIRLSEIINLNKPRFQRVTVDSILA